MLNDLLLADLTDSVSSFLLLCLASLAVELLLVLGYATIANRKYYQTVPRRTASEMATSNTSRQAASADPPLARMVEQLPAFRSLPSLAVFPGMLLILLSLCATDLIQTSSAVYSAHATDYAVGGAIASFAIFVFFAAVAVLLHQVVSIVRFYKHDAPVVWQGAGTLMVAEMDDPILRCLARCKLIKPRARCAGEYSPARIEPARTERTVKRALTFGGLLPRLGNCYRGTALLDAITAEEKSAHRYEMLSLWLSFGSGGSLRGAIHGMVIMCLQLSLTLVITVYSALDDLYPWAKSTCLGAACGVQLLMAIWVVAGDPIDRLAAYSSCLVSLLECIATALLLIVVLIGDVGDGRIAEADAGALAGASTALLMASVYAPLSLTVYDSILLPVAAMVKGKSCGDAIFTVLTAFVLLPVTIVTSLFGIKGRSAQLAAGTATAVAKAAMREATTKATRMRSGSRAERASAAEPEHAEAGSVTVASDTEPDVELLPVTSVAVSTVPVTGVAVSALGASHASLSMPTIEPPAQAPPAISTDKDSPSNLMEDLPDRIKGLFSPSAPSPSSAPHAEKVALQQPKLAPTSEALDASEALVA